MNNISGAQKGMVAVITVPAYVHLSRFSAMLFHYRLRALVDVQRARRSTSRIFEVSHVSLANTMRLVRPIRERFMQAEGDVRTS